MTRLLEEILRDPRLSYRAKGLGATLALFHAEDVPGSQTLANRAVEGRDALQRALRELIECGYMARARYQDPSGRWKTVQVMVEPTPGKPKPDFQAVSICTYTYTENLIETPNGVSIQDSLDSESTREAFSVQIGKIEEEPENKAALRRRKYTKPAFDPESEPIERWNGRHFAEYFARNAVGPGQVNRRAITGATARWVRDGSSPAEIRDAMRVFLETEGHTSGNNEIPLWKRFLVWYPAHHARFAPAVDFDYLGEMHAQRRRV